MNKAHRIDAKENEFILYDTIKFCTHFQFKKPFHLKFTISFCMGSRFALCAGDRGDDGFQGLQVRQSKRQMFQLDLETKAPKKVCKNDGKKSI